MEVNLTKEVVITSTIKNLLPVNERNVKTLSNAGLVTPEQDTMIQNTLGDFNFCLPLKMLMGFALKTTHAS